MTSPAPQDRHAANERVRRSLASASRHWSDFEATLHIFQANIQRLDFAGAEAERPRLEALLVDYLDQYALAGRLAQQLGDPA